MSNVDIFIASTLRGHRMSTNVQGAVIPILPADQTIPLVCPPLCIIPRHAFTPDVEAQFMVKVGLQLPEKKKQGATTIYLLHKPDMISASKYITASVDRVAPNPSYVTPQGFMAIAYCRALLTGFLRTQTYPAWKDIGDAHTELEIQGKLDLEVQIRGLKRVIVGETTRQKRVKTLTEDGEEFTVDAEDDDEDAHMEEYVEQAFSTEVEWESIKESVLVAKPSPLPLSYNVGAPAEVPYMPGICFPYFDRMMISDNTTMRHIVLQRSLRNMGDSRDEQRKVFKQVKIGLEQIGRLAVGQVLTHLLIGMNLAIETQSRMFVVYVSSEYAGFVLLGAGFSVLIDDVWHEVKDADELQTDVLALSSHQYAVSKVAGILSKLVVEESARVDKKKSIEEIKPEALTSGQKLWEEMEKRTFTEDAQEQMTEVIGMIGFSRSYKPINLENIMWALEMIVVKPTEPLPKDLPLYVPPTYGEYGDRVLKVLCCFGPDSFSLVNASGTKYSITPFTTKVDPNDALNESGKGKVLPFIPVSVKSVQTAKVDMYAFLKRREIQVDFKERAIPNRCILFKGDSRDKLYAKMREVCSHKSIEDAAAKIGKKRNVEGIPKDSAGVLDLF